MLTIIIPVYNEAPFLKRCLNSIVRQTKKASVIIIDDGSTDGSGEICEEYRCMGFEIYHIENRGPSYARNYGLDRVKTEWVTFLDADDEYLPDAVENMLKESTRKDKMIGFNQLRHYKESGKIVQKYYNKPGVYNIHNFPKQLFAVWNKMYRIDFLNENKIRFWEGLDYGEDEIFNLECILKTKEIRYCRPCTIIRHFDNKNSIVHLIMGKDLDIQRKALTKLYSQQDGLGRMIIGRVLDEHNKSGWDKIIRAKTCPTD